MVSAARSNNFDSLRLIGAVLVLYGHSYALTGATPPAFAANGVHTLGVKIFFVISGYLIAQSWLRDRDLFRFLLRRCLRIFPALAMVVFLTICVLGPIFTTLPLSDYFNSPRTIFYLWNIGLYVNYALPGVFEQNVYPGAVNGSLWSLPAEFLMYLITPFLLSRLINRHNLSFIMIAAGVIVADLLAQALTLDPQLTIYGTSISAVLQTAPYFLIGSAFALYRLERFANIYVAFMGLLALGVFATSGPVKEAMLLLILPYACVAFGLGYAPVFRRITKGNDLSYGIFLYAFPVQQALSATLGPQIGPWGNFVAALAICIGLAYLSWKLVERPTLGLKPVRREAPPAALPCLAGS
jgi:peptidoglycan/LPS O-acetylase OafA/YrhL